MLDKETMQAYLDENNLDSEYNDKNHTLTFYKNMNIYDCYYNIVLPEDTQNKQEDVVLSGASDLKLVTNEKNIKLFNEVAAAYPNLTLTMHHNVEEFFAPRVKEELSEDKANTEEVESFVKASKDIFQTLAEKGELCIKWIEILKKYRQK